MMSASLVPSKQRSITADSLQSIVLRTIQHVFRPWLGLLLYLLFKASFTCQCSCGVAPCSIAFGSGVTPAVSWFV